MTLKFSASLYSKGSIDFAVAQYGDFAKIEVEETKKAFNVTISGMEEEHKDLLPGEFSNCALTAMREGS